MQSWLVQRSENILMFNISIGGIIKCIILWQSFLPSGLRFFFFHKKFVKKSPRSYSSLIQKTYFPKTMWGYVFSREQVIFFFLYIQFLTTWIFLMGVDILKALSLYKIRAFVNFEDILCSLKHSRVVPSSQQFSLNTITTSVYQIQSAQLVKILLHFSLI